VQALIVDDIATNRDVFSTMLTGIGIQVETAKSGAEGLERIGEKMPDILFLDIRMPVMDGPKMLELLFERYGKDATVAVAVTASVFDHQRQDYLDGVFPGSSISRCASNRFTSVFPSNWGSPSNTPRREMLRSRQTSTGGEWSCRQRCTGI
jgi:CheY-like chemotaxis protein